jgi:hypothetical protein
VRTTGARVFGGESCWEVIVKRFAVPGVVLAIAAFIGSGLASKQAEVKAADRDEEIDIGGRNAYKAQLMGGGFEEGTVVIEKNADTYNLTFTRKDGGAYSAIGIRTDDLLSVCYSYPGAGERGVGAFQIKKGPKLVGQWSTFGGDGKLHSDTWTAKK